MRTQTVKIYPKEFCDSDLLSAAETIKRGGLVIFPTETVYGLGADATSSSAAKKISSRRCTGK